MACIQNVKGVFIDWTEFGAYRFENLFAGVGSHSQQMARAFGYDWPRLSASVKTLWNRLHHLQEADLRPADTALRTLIDNAPGFYA